MTWLLLPITLIFIN
jgi:hypothetical protein